MMHTIFNTKHYCFILFIFQLISLNLFAQRTYTFDYYTIYNYKRSLKDSLAAKKEITYSNSKDSSYNLLLVIKSDTIYSAEIRDYLNEKVFIYKDRLHQNNLNDISLFKNVRSYPYNLSRCKQSKRSSFYIVKHYEEKGEKVINIKRLRNKKRKRLINESFYKTFSSPISKNQHYNFPVLASPLWCRKLELKNDEIIRYSYFVEKGDKILHIRELTKIENVNFVLTIEKTTP